MRQRWGEVGRWGYDIKKAPLSFSGARKDLLRQLSYFKIIGAVGIVPNQNEVVFWYKLSLVKFTGL
jgi:hypothetical protein